MKTPTKISTKISAILLFVIIPFIIPCLAEDSLIEIKLDNTNSILNSKTIQVYYFHGDRRCKTCNSIEANTKLLLESKFAAEMKSGKIKWSVINTDKKENSHFEKDFDLLFGSVVVVKLKDSKQVEWKNLQRVWELVWDKSGFNKYVENEIKMYQEK